MSTDQKRLDAYVRQNSWCRHFSGVRNERCKAGVCYREAFPPPWPKGTLPCTNRDSQCKCEKADWPPHDEAVADAKRRIEHADKMLSALLDLRDCRAKLAEVQNAAEAKLAITATKLAEAEAALSAQEVRSYELLKRAEAAEAREAELREVLADSRPACEWCAGHADDYPTVIQATELLAKIDAALATGGKEGA